MWTYQQAIDAYPKFSVSVTLVIGFMVTVFIVSFILFTIKGKKRKEEKNIDNFAFHFDNLTSSLIPTIGGTLIGFVILFGINQILINEWKIDVYEKYVPTIEVTSGELIANESDILRKFVSYAHKDENGGGKLHYYPVSKMDIKVDMVNKDKNEIKGRYIQGFEEYGIDDGFYDEGLEVTVGADQYKKLFGEG